MCVSLVGVIRSSAWAFSGSGETTRAGENTGELPSSRSEPGAGAAERSAATSICSLLDTLAAWTMAAVPACAAAVLASKTNTPRPIHFCLLNAATQALCRSVVQWQERGHSYYLDWNTMQQVNTKHQTKRGVERVVGGKVDWDYYPYYGRISTEGWTVDKKPE